MTFRAARRGPLESDTCTNVVLPMLAGAGWESPQIVPQYAVKGSRVVSSGGVQGELPDGRVDYVLEINPGLPVAVIEAKREYRKRRTDSSKPSAMPYSLMLQLDSGERSHSTASKSLGYMIRPLSTFVAHQEPWSQSTPPLRRRSCASTATM